MQKITVHKSPATLHPFPASRQRKIWDATEEFLGCDGGMMGSYKDVNFLGTF